jgi:hypothetical protein
MKAGNGAKNGRLGSNRLAGAGPHKQAHTPGSDVLVKGSRHEKHKTHTGILMRLGAKTPCLCACLIRGPPCFRQGLKRPLCDHLFKDELAVSDRHDGTARARLAGVCGRSGRTLSPRLAESGQGRSGDGKRADHAAAQPSMAWDENSEKVRERQLSAYEVDDCLCRTSCV